VAEADPSAGAKVSAAEQDFTFDLLREVATGKNTVVSPSSLALALAMLETGATGQTAAQIAKVLHTSGLTAGQQDAGWSTLMSDLTAAAKHDAFALESANSLWLQKGQPVVPAYLTALKQYFDSGVWQADFAQDPARAVAAFNAWVSQQTHGKITNLLSADQVQQAVAIIANATYFKAAWATPFQKQATTNSTFHLGNGATVTVPFLHGENVYPAASTTDFTAVQIPYQSRAPLQASASAPADPGGRFAALIVMPTTQSLSQFVSTMSAASINTIVSELGNGRAVSVPKFDLADSNDLVAPLKHLGMTDAFGQATLDGMFPNAMPGDYFVSDVVQKATLKVDESGSEASAATALVMETAGLTMQIAIDHPFLFLIRDTKTGAILFAAEVQNPAA
jgi:serpin B